MILNYAENADVIIKNYRKLIQYILETSKMKIMFVPHVISENNDDIQNSFAAVWRECDKHILLYNVNHGLNTKEYIAINNEFTRFLGNEQLPTHYGGEFFAANIKNAKCFETETLKVYETMKKQGFATTKGDEFIVSLAANKMKDKIKNASPYVHRFWTGSNFRLISTCYRYNPVIALHLPAEKEKGIVKLYKRYFAKGKLPANKSVLVISRFWTKFYFLSATGKRCMRRF